MDSYLADSAPTLTIDGPSARFAYRRLGTPGGTPLVLLNRFRGTIDHWDPLFLDLLADNHDVVIFDNAGIGYSTGEAPDTIEAIADGAVEFIRTLGLSTVDLLGWSLGGAVAQSVTLRNPGLVRRLVVAASGPGTVPGQPPADPRAQEIMLKPDATDDDMTVLFYPETEAARAAGRAHLNRIRTRLEGSGATVTEAAAYRQLQAAAGLLGLPFDEVRKNLQAIEQPVLYANGMQDIGVPAYASYVAVQHLSNATLVLYGDAGHAFLFQHAEQFSTQVTHFLAD